MADWLDEFFEEQDRAREKEQRQSQLDDLGRMASLSLFRQLWARVESDVNRFKEKTHDEGIATSYVQGNGFTIQRPQFPTFQLNVKLETAGVMSYQTSIQVSRSLSRKLDEGQILTIAKAQDEIYYRVGGQDYADASDVSKLLLMPLFAILKI